MFKNLFGLKVYFVDEKCPYNKQEANDLDYYLSHNYMTRIVQSINYQDNEYLVGDIFVNKDTKSLYIFSFLTCENTSSIRKLGFYYLKDSGVLIDSSRYNISHFVDFKSTIDGFDFFKMNGLNTNNLIKIGNLLLDSVSEIITEYEYLNEYTNIALSIMESAIINLRDNIRKINDLVITYKETDKQKYNYGGYNNYFIGSLCPQFIIGKDFKFYPKLYVEDKLYQYGFEAIHKQICILNDKLKYDKKLCKRYICYFDLETFESKLVAEGGDNDFDYLSKSSFKYNVLNEDDNKNNYIENLLYFL